MKSLYRKSSPDLPALNLASLPDLIFTVLFFFMLVTHMRADDPKVRYEVPAGTEVQKLTQKSSVLNIYIGPSLTGEDDSELMIQVNSDIVPLTELRAYINAYRKSLSAENAERMTVSLKADRCTPMGMVADVKAELQKSFALKINYSGSQSK